MDTGTGLSMDLKSEMAIEYANEELELDQP